MLWVDLPRFNYNIQGKCVKTNLYGASISRWNFIPLSCIKLVVCLLKPVEFYSLLFIVISVQFCWLKSRCV